MTTATKKRIGWTKLERVEKTGRHWRSYRAYAPWLHSCYLCGTRIEHGERYMAGSLQLRAYRSVRDMGETRFTARICADCIFKGPPVTGINGI